MKTNIVANMETLLKSYNKEVENHKNIMEQIALNRDYSEEYKKQLSDDQRKRMEGLDIDFSNKFDEMLKVETNDILASDVDDNELKVANALKFIEMAGKNITDSFLYDNIKPFIESVPMMRQFGFLLQGVDGADGLAVSKNIMNKYESMANEIDVIKSGSKDLFNHKVNSSLTQAMTELILKSKADSIQKHVDTFESIKGKSYDQAKMTLLSNTMEVN